MKLMSHKDTKFRLYEESGVFITHHLNVCTLSNVSESTLVHFSCWHRDTYCMRPEMCQTCATISYKAQYCIFLNPVFCTKGHFVSAAALCHHHPCHAHLLYSTVTFTCCGASTWGPWHANMCMTEKHTTSLPSLFFPMIFWKESSLLLDFVP